MIEVADVLLLTLLATLFFIILALGRKKITNKIVKFFYYSYSAAIFLMLIMPSFWHAFTAYRAMGFLGLNYSQSDISRVLPWFCLSIIYIYSLTTIAFILLSSRNKKNARILKLSSSEEPISLPLLGLFFVSCIYYLNVYFGSFAQMFLMRNRDVVELPIFFEILRGLLIVANVYSLVILLRTTFTKQRISYIVAMAVFFFSTLIIFGFGSRHLFLYSLLAIFASEIFPYDHRLLRRNKIFASILLLTFILLSYIQSNMRYSGLVELADIVYDFDQLLLAFDQFNSSIVAFVTYSDTPGFISRWVTSNLTDMFFHFIPRELLQLFGVQKETYYNYLAWNAYLVGDVYTNITPLFIGQAIIEVGVIGIVLLPFVIICLVWILVKSLNLIQRNSRSIINSTVSVALISGALFNLIRFMGGSYIFYFFLYFVLLILLKSLYCLFRLGKVEIR